MYAKHLIKLNFAVKLVIAPFVINQSLFLYSSQARREVLLSVSNMKQPLLCSDVTKSRVRQTLVPGNAFQINFDFINVMNK